MIRLSALTSAECCCCVSWCAEPKSAPHSLELTPPSGSTFSSSPSSHLPQNGAQSSLPKMRFTLLLGLCVVVTFVQLAGQTR